MRKFDSNEHNLKLRAVYVKPDFHSLLSLVADAIFL